MSESELLEKIKSEIAKTEQVIEEYKGMTKPVSPDVAIGRISRVDAIQNQSITESALRQAEQKLRGLNIVLSKVGTPNGMIPLMNVQGLPIS